MASASQPSAPRRPPRRLSGRFRGRGREVIIAIAVVLLVLLLSLRAIARFFVDYLWFDSVDHGEMFWGMLRPRLTLFAMFGLLFVLIAVLNLLIADRLAPTSFSANMHPLVERFHEFFGHRLRSARLAVAVVLGVLVAIPATTQWQQWLMFRNSKGFGISDPQFGNDVGFYLFKLPFLAFAIDWLFFAMILITLLVVATHALNGGIVFTPPRPKVREATKAHVAVLLAILSLLKGADYWVARYEATTDTRGIVRGALYAVVKAELPAITLLALIAVMVAGLFLSTLKTGAWRLPLVASALWVVMAIIAGLLAPAVVQSLIVNPNQKDREAPYIARNVAATRNALGIGNVETQSVTVGSLTREELTGDLSPLSDVRMLSPEVVRSRFNADFGNATGMAFNDLDPDRYELDGRVQQVVVGARELDLRSVGNTSWQGTHLISTHGCGVVMAPANRVDSIGRPAYQEPELERPELYVSPSLGGYSIVNTGVTEQACIGQDNAGRYSGRAGVQLSSGFRRLAFALSYLDYNLFGSSAITEQSRVIAVRRVQDRVRKLAPFLSFDGDPYPVMLGGRVVWVVDGYTTSDHYPYAQSGDRSQLDAASGLRHPFNYVRNSVKAVVDAYDATVDLYVVDDNDPIIDVWQAAFPKLFKSAAEMPDGLAEHLRYPEDLFRIQTAAYSKYQLDPANFLERGLAWSVAKAPVTTPSQSRVGTSATVATGEDESDAPVGLGLAADNAAQRFVPYFTMFRAPGSPATAQPTFQMIRPFVPFSPDDSRPELRAFMTVSSDPADYGRLVSYRIDNPKLPDGPTKVQADIESDSVVSSNLSLWNQQGSAVTFGDLQLVPIGDSIAWVRPLYLQPESANQPSFQQVVVSVGGQVAMGRTLRAALGQLFPGFDTPIGDVLGEPGGTTGGTPGGTGGTPGTPTTEPGTGTPTVSTPADLLADAQRLFNEADAALKEGDLGTYQAKVRQAEQLVTQAAALLKG